MNESHPGEGLFSALNADREIKIAVEQIVSGLALYQSGIPGAKNFWISMPLLSSGVERLQKMVLHLLSLDQDGTFLDTSVLVKHSHRLDEMHRSIVQRYGELWRDIPALAADYEYLTSSGLLRCVLKFMKKFLFSGRYFHLTGVGDGTPVTDDPLSRWEKIEAATIPKDRRANAVLENYRAYREEVNCNIVACIERLLRAYARIIVFTRATQDVMPFTVHLGRFITLTDSQLGTTKYKVGSE